MTLATTLARTLPTSAARPTESGNTDLKGLSKMRLRTSDGKRGTKEDIEKDIIKHLEKPQTPSMLAAAMHRNPKALYRGYLKPMLAAKKIEQSGDYYKRPGAAEVVVQRERFDDIVEKSAFKSLPILEKFVAHMRTIEAGGSFLTTFQKICLGKKVAGFKCRPEHWTVETTPKFMQLYLEATQRDRAPFSMRQLMRYIHADVLGKDMTDQQKRDWGCDGDKDDAGQYSHVRLTEGQIIKLAQHYLDKGDLQFAGYVSVGIETFGRPKALHDAETSKFHLTERTITKATIQGWSEPIYDSKFMPVLQALSLTDKRIRIESFKAPAIEGELYENKTEDIWPKRILGAHAVKVATDLLHERRSKPTLFNWQGMSHSKWETFCSETLRKGYREIGVTGDYFYKKPMYALRHVGAQMWLNRTGYDYAGVAEMGWTDIATLHKYYGGYSMEFFNQKVAVAYA